MKLNLKVIPNAKEERILEENDRLRVYVKKQAFKGEANKALIELLARHFNVKKKNIRIILGEKSREKVVEIL
ncbi:DUF167 domain-containing protein [Candidatus Woesearchaeota archaeon]|nr:DUF167 domain-containing protein [Candidatus Woesearchaeota archaeon]